MRIKFAKIMIFIVIISLSGCANNSKKYSTGDYNTPQYLIDECNNVIFDKIFTNYFVGTEFNESEFKKRINKLGLDYKYIKKENKDVEIKVTNDISFPSSDTLIININDHGIIDMIWYYPENKEDMVDIRYKTDNEGLEIVQMGLRDDKTVYFENIEEIKEYIFEGKVKRAPTTEQENFLNVDSVNLLHLLWDNTLYIRDNIENKSALKEYCEIKYDELYFINRDLELKKDSLVDLDSYNIITDALSKLYAVNYSIIRDSDIIFLEYFPELLDVCKFTDSGSAIEDAIVKDRELYRLS